MQLFKKQKNYISRTAKRRIFALLMLAIPLLQFAIFYVYVNLNSILMAFSEYTFDIENSGYIVEFVGFANFEKALDIMLSPIGGEMLLNSLKLYGCNLVIVMGLALIFSYYIAKKFPMAGFVRVVLYLPHVVSSVVFAILYRYLVTDVYMDFVLKLTGAEVSGLLELGNGTQYSTILFYNIWMGFGINVMLFTNAMSGINSSVLESAKLDGVNIVQEFIYIYIPMIFPTFITFIVTGLAGLFTNQMALLAFFGDSGKNEFNVYGFYLYVKALRADYVGETTYSMLSAMGLIITLIIAPLTIGVRKLLMKYGPRVD